MKIIGSHNSWTCNHSVWWQFPISWIGKCQNIPIIEQIEYCNLFDLRLRFHNGIPYVHHGIFNFGKFNEEDLNLLKGCYLRIILECNHKLKDQEEQEKYFKEYCSKLETTYPNIYFFGGNRKYDWKEVYLFKHADIPLLEMHSSVQNWNKWFPYLYACNYNTYNKQMYIDNTDNTKAFFYDFVQIC